MEKLMKVWEKRDRQAKKAREGCNAVLGSLAPVLGGINQKAEELYERKDESLGDGASCAGECAASESVGRRRKRRRRRESV